MRSGAEFVSRVGIEKVNLNYIVKRLRECADRHRSCLDCPDMEICVRAYDERCSLGIEGERVDLKKLGKDVKDETGKGIETRKGVITQAMEVDPNKVVKTARQEHRCHRCGGVIKCGDRFTMRLDYEGRTLKFCPTCLGCDGRFAKKKVGNDG